ncbi:CHAT domain-containing protein [Candidatus Oscillochloris fontis]|uniref:nSTAND1 domain-containing NTPase n=1 Tax=Candidatus Oscillochloris fontis TaxID=2496868 RepID=UPI00101C28FC|nr:CHAT domain-containing protein [Candidatus Oscillochloris fontis]
MDTFEITIQRRDGTGWPVIVEQSHPQSLTPERSEGRLHFNLEELRGLEVQPLAYGRFLGEALFHGSIHDAFRRALARSEDRLRVLLFIEDAELRGLRWERLCAPIDADWPILALSQRAPFSRYLPSLTDRRFPQIGRQDLRMLIVAASPANMSRFRLEPFDVAAAVSGVQRALEGLPTSLLSDLPDSAGPPSLDAICAQISAEPFTMLHIVCHGRVMPDGESVIFLARDDNPAEVDPVPAARLIERLGNLQGARGLPRFTFLSTCESASPGADVALGGLAQRLVRDLGMPAVVAMTDKVQISTANALAAAFYPRLREHGEVDRALVEASAGLAERGTILVPVLFSRLGGQPLFSDSLDRPLSADDIAAGLGLLGPLVGERAPILRAELDSAAATIRRTLRADPGGLTREARQERDAAMAAIETICAEASDLSFRALALGQPVPPYDERCPFPGLRSFRADGRDFFFGREPLVQRLIQRLAQQPFLAVLGASGSGKSSLVFAGVLPALQASSPTLQVITFTPGERPQLALESALASTATGERIVVVDQFEEAFTICQDLQERSTFFQTLLDLHPQTPVIITMRADFLGEVAPYAALRDRVQSAQELVAPMTPEELRRAMELQAAAVGLRFEADLSGQILDDVRGEPGAMPLLQHALQELWQRRRGRWLRAIEYRNVGGIHQAIAHTADQIYTACRPADQERLRDIFVRLTRLDRDALAGEERRDTRQRVTLHDLTPAGADPAPLRELLRQLADARLIVTGVDASGAETVEVAHEALIRSWPRLRGWLEQDRAGLLLRDSIRQAALEWQREAHDPALLFRGGRLDEALALALLARFAPNELERHFLDASAAQREQEAAEKEAVRQRELEQARALAAEQQQRAEEQATAASQLRRRAIFLAGVAVVAVVAMVAAVIFGAQAQRSEQAAKLSAAEANQRALIANAQTFAGQGQTDLAMALSFQAASSDSPLRAANSVLASIAENAARWRIKPESSTPIYGMTVSPQGDQLFLAADSGVEVWGMEQGTLLRSLSLSAISNLAVAPQNSEPMMIMDANGQLVPVESAPQTLGVGQLIISPDGSQVVATSSYSLLSWGVAGGRSYREALGEMQPGLIDFLPDSHTLALASSSEGPLLFDLATQRITRRFSPPADTFSLISLDVNQQGSLIAAVYESPAMVVIWDLRSSNPNPIHTITNEGGYYGPAMFSADGSRLAVIVNGLTVEVWETNSYSLLFSIKHDTLVTALALHPDNHMVATGTTDGLVHLWSDMNAERSGEAEELRRYSGHTQGISINTPIDSLIFSPDGSRIISAARDMSVRVWDSAGYTTPNDAWPSEEAASYPDVGGQIVAVSADQQQIAIFRSPDGSAPEYGSTGDIGIWNMAQGSAQMLGSGALLPLAHFSPDGSTFLVQDSSGMLQIYTTANLSLVRELGPINGIYRISPNGQQIAAQSKAENGTQTIALWDLTSGSISATLNGEQSEIYSSAYTKDGRLLAVGYENGRIEIWDVGSASLRHSIIAHRQLVMSLDFSHDQHYLLSGGGDKLVRLWDVASGELERDFSSLLDVIASVALSANGDLVHATDQLGNSVTWSNLTGKALVEWVRANRYLPELSCAERARYLVEPICP